MKNTQQFNKKYNKQNNGVNKVNMNNMIKVIFNEHRKTVTLKCHLKG
jgi:hypothetical protein